MLIMSKNVELMTSALVVCEVTSTPLGRLDEVEMDMSIGETESTLPTPALNSTFARVFFCYNFEKELRTHCTNCSSGILVLD